ncbi:molecular chaperone HtpG [Yanshouia hominis]|mgnify:FL=1|uniref:Chaperone protein HtpG n=1 Tax=Yanshouia hominis TaxID=2763673 RepID=A0ABR7NI36_9FIRM|nr:molecular chaperone HtpG [Yanshouia hominis]MBC8576066.1 molecular chaperone HtpG [Yanshouia hominis]
MAKKQFRTESKRILDLMVNSIYTNKEIFLRELISNASDAIDKLYFRSLTDQSVGMSRSDFAIDLAIDKDARTLTVSDNGIGMTAEELEKNLGTIAHSGSLDFTKNNELSDEIDIIGQFGVGFYSAFMVADRISVTSRAFGADSANRWESEGGDGYTVSPAEKETAGTEIVLHLKENTEHDKFDEFLDPWRVSSIVKRYSDYIRYPIRMEMEHQQRKETEEKDENGNPKVEYETTKSVDTLNSMVPIWKRNKKDVTDEEYKSFYKEKFYDYAEPLRVIHQKAEGTTEYQALLYIPSHAEFNYYSKDFERGLQLYSSGVMIMERCADLLPEYFGFVKGLVDSEDLSLNISREMLQHDRQLTLIRTALEKRIKHELSDMLEKSREDYEKFWNTFGLTIKFGIYQSYGANRGQLEDLLLFRRASDGKLVTLKEYADAMPEGQKYCYYAAGESFEKLSKLPQTELLRDKGYDLLCLTDTVDEFLFQILHSYSEKDFRSVSSGDLGLESDEEKAEQEKLEGEYKELFDCMKEALGDRVTEVRLSSSLKTHPVCLTAKGAVSLEMEKVLNTMPGSEQKVKAQRVLELNGGHPVFEALKALWPEQKEKVATYAELLYDQALLIEGLSVEDPIRFSNAICELMK